MRLKAVIDANHGQPARAFPSGEGQRLAGLRLLVVEDNPVNQQVAQELLQSEGALVALAGGGLEGVQRALDATPAFDVILMDLQMPGIDGHEATRRILAQQPQATVIAMTANAMASDRSACLATGMVDHISKPVDLESLVARLRRHVGRLEGPMGLPPAAVVDADGAAMADIAVLDRAAALQRLGGRLPLYDRLVAAFLLDAPGQLDALEAQVVRADVAGALRTLHTLRGLAGAIGALALAAHAGREEQAVRAAPAARAAALAAPRLPALRQRLSATLQALAAVEPAPAALVAPAALGASPSTPPRPAPAVKVQDEPLASLRQLRILLVERNMRAVAAAEALAARHGADPGAELSALSVAVSRLDFARALRVCDILLARLQPRD